MKRQILIMSIIYFIVMALGYFWCNPNLIENLYCLSYLLKQ